MGSAQSGLPSFLPAFLSSFANRVVPGEISCHFDLAVSKPPRQRRGVEGLEGIYVI